VVVRDLAKVEARVRFSYPAPTVHLPAWYFRPCVLGDFTPLRLLASPDLHSFRDASCLLASNTLCELVETHVNSMDWLAKSVVGYRFFGVSSLGTPPDSTGAWKPVQTYKTNPNRNIRMCLDGVVKDRSGCSPNSTGGNSGNDKV
jgi:hypothetical protein